MQAAVTEEALFALLFEGVNDSDLVDGAGQVILEFLKSSFDGVSQMEILDKMDLQKAIGVFAVDMKEEGLFEERKAVLNRALRLLRAGYYRSLLIEERKRVGRVSYRLEAMMRFRDSIMKGHIERDGPGISQYTLQQLGT